LKRPAFQFYPGDWLRDTALRACSLAARGLWMDMISFMHQGYPYGYLTLPAKDGDKDTLRPILPTILARMVGAAPEEVEGLLVELEHAGVFSRTDDRTIFSRRMVSDEKIRETRASGGANSLNNPNVPRPKSEQKDTLQGSLGVSLAGSFEVSPSSSSSSSKNITSEQKSSSDALFPSEKKKQQPSREAVKLADLLKSEILRNKSDYRITQQQERKWAITADRMLRIDKRKFEEVAELIPWVQRNEFWMANVLSMEKLREKFDQLMMAARAKSHAQASSAQKLPSDYVPASEQMKRELQQHTAVAP
jgi:hypothetical protein